MNRNAKLYIQALDASDIERLIFVGVLKVSEVREALELDEINNVTITVNQNHVDTSDVAHSALTKEKRSRWQRS